MALVVIMAVPTPARFTAEGPCPRRHHHRLPLPSATCLSWPRMPGRSSRAYWGCWPGWLTRGIAAGCVTGWRSSWGWRCAR
jgi:hypothetical protein